MEKQRAELLFRSIVSRSEQLQRHLPEVADARGSSLGPLLQYICENIATKAESLWSDLQTAADEDVETYLRSLHNWLTIELSLHEMIAKYDGEIDRHDLPVGLLYLIDSVVTDLLGDDFDPIIHSDYKQNYSTDSLLHDLQPVIKQCSGTEPAIRKPVAFNVPALDPANALLSPILVHEATHTVLRVTPLIAELGKVMPPSVAKLASQYTDASGHQWPNRVFENWVSELLCDCMALLVTGPSFPLALSALSSSLDAMPYTTTHPFMVDRLHIAWQQMANLGWAALVAERNPKLADWFESMSQQPTRTDQAEVTLKKQVLEVAVPILEVCSARIADPLTVDSYLEVEEAVVSDIASGVPPASPVGTRTPIAWEIVLAGWMHGLAPEFEMTTVPSLVADDEYSRFLIKSIELSAIAILWQSEG